MDYIRASDSDGHPLPLVQLNKSRWRLSGAEKGARIEYQLFVNEPGPYGAELAQKHAFFDLAEVLTYTDDTRRQESVVEFRNLPAGWKIATSLTQEGNSYKAADYDALVDGPVEIGTFQERDFEGACGQYRVIVDSTDAATILPRIVPLLEKIVNAATAWMNDCPFKTYTFIYHLSEDATGGGMEHAYGTAITLPKDDVQEDLDPFTSVTAHEFFHLWNVKRLRPQSLEPIDYTRENYTKALWFCEGVDSAVSDLIRLKAGLLDEHRYFYDLSQGIRELENRPAHLTQSVEDASLDAWLEKYPFYGLRDRSISYYNKGELLGVLLDLKMRQVTRGRASLQTLFRWMNDYYAKQGKFFADSEGVLNGVQEITGSDFHQFFSDYVSGVREIPWDEFFSPVGLHIVTNEVAFADPGFDFVQKFDRAPAIVRVEPGGAADKAGVKSDDEIISMNGAAAGRDFGSEIEKLGPGSSIRITVRRDGEPLQFQWKLGERRIKFYQLQDLHSITPQQRRARSEWLSAVASGAN
jgi:predicted metalloprotease with PDZ domain